ncbi:2-oxo-4-hydroxy-4-carboxy-5-ureidoimidazoline decarboxylase [Streptomyces sp. NPDC057116]|uniref:2-oxo-4-hydroxy-4-carboxy-5-ureidoimidazoline decarboxylase n=1 Tax=Streptomyces sp. NPDC057116 TaxID=3346023 RepID=UPI00363EFFC8
MAGDSTAGAPKRPPTLPARAGTPTARPRHAPPETARAPGPARRATPEGAPGSVRRATPETTLGSVRRQDATPEAGAPGTRRAEARTGPIPAQSHGSHAAEGLIRLNAATAQAAEAALLACCGSRRWAQRLAAHRPYPTLDALLAAADEASYDLSGADLDEALADETSADLPPSTPAAARTAWRAAHAEYESRFRHAFVICLDGHRPEERLNQALSAIHTRMSHPAETERAIAADELRRLARSRLSRLVTGPGHPNSPSVLV